MVDRTPAIGRLADALVQAWLCRPHPAGDGAGGRLRDLRAGWTPFSLLGGNRRIAAAGYLLAAAPARRSWPMPAAVPAEEPALATVRGRDVLTWQPQRPRNIATAFERLGERTWSCS